VIVLKTVAELVSKETERKWYRAGVGG